MVDDASRQAFARTGIAIDECLDNRYKIISVLGQGGMGTVFKATNLSLNKTVAIKALHPHIVLDKFATSRFQQEIKAMSMLSHPHLISVVDAGTSSSGTPYFVMELLDGPSLSDILQEQGPMQDMRAIRVFVQIADALSYAHEEGIIHRDLKPSNVVVLSNRGKDFIKLVDLGIAKLLTAEGGETQHLTMTGEIFGSPIYMSPEQCSGKKVDARSDIYSLGCLMFETVCGDPPIKGGSALETFSMHVNSEAPLLSTRANIQMTPALKRLEHVIARCIQKAPESRYQSMEELARDLEAIEQSSVRDSHHLPAASMQAISPISKPGREPKSPAISKNAAVAAGVFCVVLMLGLGGVFLLQSLTHRQAPPVVPVSQPQPQPQPEPQPQPQPVQLPSVPTQTNSVPSVPSVTMLPPAQHYTVSYPATAASKSNVDVVAVYMGDNQEAGNLQLPGTVKVVVHNSPKPISLVLVSYMPTNWQIEREGPAVKIDRVMVSSYRSPVTVTGVPPGVPVEKSWYNFLDENGAQIEKARKNPFQFFVVGTALIPGSPNVETSGDFQTMKKIVEEHLHQSINSFQGAYHETQFDVQ